VKVHLIGEGAVQRLSSDQQRALDLIGETALGGGVPTPQLLCDRLGFDAQRADRVLAELQELGAVEFL
jgi:DNA-binding IclR family transcriptional regulator